jgi:hypothetical protein
MRVLGRFLLVSAAFLSSLALAQSSDQVVAAQVLGPQWKQLSRRAGTIFAGTLLTAPTQIPPSKVAAADYTPGPFPSIHLTFRVDEPIAGVEPGQILTIHEWAAAYSMNRPLNTGQHVLLFLYPPSRLGLTSPVGGSLGQIALDATGTAHSDVTGSSATLLQLERAIRTARSNATRANDARRTTDTRRTEEQ